VPLKVHPRKLRKAITFGITQLFYVNIVIDEFPVPNKDAKDKQPLQDKILLADPRKVVLRHSDEKLARFVQQLLVDEQLDLGWLGMNLVIAF
jgi:hypothetical protein